jgi:myo-inositol-1(or 4)-monophosphatase
MHNIPFASHAPLINVLTKILYQAATKLVRDFGELEYLQTTRKSLRPFQDRAERAVIESIASELEKTYRNASVIVRLPQTPQDLSHESFFVIPIDGLPNLMHTYPHLAIGICYFRGGMPILSVIYNPLADELFWAEKGKGAFLNKRRLRMSKRELFHDSIIAWDGSGSAPICQSIRVSGCSLLDIAYAAAGRCDGCCLRQVSPAMSALAEPMIHEAGGVISTPMEPEQAEWSTCETWWALPPLLMASLQKNFN